VGPEVGRWPIRAITKRAEKGSFESWQFEKKTTKDGR